MGQTALSEEQDYNTDLPVGEVLRRARMHYGRSLADVERDLRIRVSQIEAIETGNLEKLPARVYAIGFVRTYAEYLGLDGSYIVRLFKQQSSDKQQNPELHFPVTADESRTPPLWLVILSLIALVGIVIGWNGFNARDRSAVVNVPEVPKSLKEVKVHSKILGPSEYGPQQLSADIVSNVEVSTEVEEVAPAPVMRPGMTLIVKEKTQVEVFDAEGKSLVSKVLEIGDEYFIPDRAGYIMTLSNVSGVGIVVDDVEISLLDNIAKFSNGVPLDSIALKNIVNPVGPQ